MKGTTAPSRMSGCFVEDNLSACDRKLHGGREARQACADDVDLRRHHGNRLPSSASKRRNLLLRMGARGAEKPRSIMASRVCS